MGHSRVHAFLLEPEAWDVLNTFFFHAMKEYQTIFVPPFILISIYLLDCDNAHLG